MRKITLLLVAVVCSITATALDIPKGTFYFDNSLTQYESVKFVYGSDAKNETYVVNMTLDEGDRWKVTFDETVTDMYRYTFANTHLSEGKIEDTFTNVKNAISNTYGQHRTATTDVAILVGGIYVPTSGDNWAQGAWQVLSTEDLTYSGTLPVMFINTENGAEIVSKDDYINATYYLDNMGIEGVESFGSVDEQLPLEIRGRGNWTWRGYDKKPYRIKLAAKAKLLGMKKSKHFALMAGADDNLGFLRNIVGYELSRSIGMPWTPSAEPVEVVLNGEYIGLYFLTETIRVDEDRVNIVEQADNATDAAEITGGWLMEIDNYDTDPHVTIQEGNGATIWFTYKTPEELSVAQETYLINQCNAMDDAIYATDKSSTAWEELIDIDRLARFYIVQEIMDNTESFHGSCYLNKEIGDDTKWMFGPVWDFGCTFYSGYQKFIYIEPPYGQTWIGEIAKFPRFQEKVKEVWKWWKGNQYEGLDEYIDEFASEIEVAAKYNYSRWPEYGNYSMTDKKNEFNTKLTARIDWLVEQWGEGVAAIDEIEADTDGVIVSVTATGVSVSAASDIAHIRLYDLTGKMVAESCPEATTGTIDCEGGVYIVEVATASAVSHSKVAVR